MSGVGAAEHLELLPRHGDLADYSPTKPSSRTGPANLDSIRPNRSGGSVGVPQTHASVGFDAGYLPNDPPALVIASEPNRFTDPEAEPGQRGWRTMHRVRTKDRSAVREGRSALHELAS